MPQKPVTLNSRGTLKNYLKQLLEKREIFIRKVYAIGKEMNRIRQSPFYRHRIKIVTVANVNSVAI